MDRDPELDVTLSDGRRLATFQITALDRDLGTWTVVEPLVPRRVLLVEAEALATRRHLDARIAARLATGWVPVDRGATDGPGLPLPPDLQRQLGSLLGAVTAARGALRAADPSGQLWAACVTLGRHAHRFGVPAPETRRARAQRERRLGALAERAGDVAGGIRHYRAALALHPRVGVRRRLAQLEAAPPIVPPRPASPRPAIDSRRLGARRPDRAADRSPTRPVTGSVQLACRIDAALHAAVRTQAARTGQTLRAFVVQHLTQAIPRPPRRP